MEVATTPSYQIPTENGKVVIHLSSSALSKAGCILNFYRTVVEGYKEIPSAKIVIGSAIHKFVDIMFKTGNPQDALLAAKKVFDIPKVDIHRQEYLSDHKYMVNVCFNVWSIIQDDASFEVLSFDEKPATELNFSFKYYEDETIIVYLDGTIDTLGKIVNGCYCIRDFKSTSTWDKDKYHKRYELSRQLRFYRLACRLASQINPESPLGKVGSTNMGVCIDAIFLDKDPNAVSIKRSEVHQYDTDEIDKFQLQIDDFIKKLSFHIRTGYFPKEGIITGVCEHKWGYCSFWNVCKVKEHIGQMILNKEFKRVLFTPANYNGIDD